MTRIAAYKQERAARLQEQRDLREYAELVDCTFTPAITKERPRQQGPVVVRGLERHMELQVGPFSCQAWPCDKQPAAQHTAQAASARVLLSIAAERQPLQPGEGTVLRRHFVERKSLPQREQCPETAAGQPGHAVMADPPCPLWFWV